jgi:hypothetical protein
MLSSSTTANKTRWIQGVAPSNTQELRFFQITQATKIIRESSPFLKLFSTFLILWHHQAENRVQPDCVAMASKPSLLRIKLQTCLAKTQETRICWMVSSAWSQRGHAVGWGRPLLANLSAVQTLFLIASHTKNLHLKGAHDFQTRHQGPKIVDPVKKASYADLLE